MNSLNPVSVIPSEAFHQKVAPVKLLQPANDEGAAVTGSGSLNLPSRVLGPNASELQGLTELLQQHQQHLSFLIDEGSGTTVMRVIDSDSGDVIRQMPTESWLKLAQELADSPTGLVSDQA